MEAFIRLTPPWAAINESDSQQPASPPSARRPFGHFRSLSSVPSKSPPTGSPGRPARRGHGRSPSTSHLPDFSFPLSINSSPAIRPTSPSPLSDEDDLTTLPDPRTRAPSHSVNGDGGDMDGEAQDEVTALSTKLIRAINHQTTLDNALSSMRQELEQARERTRQLEALAESQREMLAGDIWVRRGTVEAEKRALSAKAAEERRLREAAEKETRRIELELENLTTALFEEANKMVVTVKEEALQKQTELEKRNAILREQVTDTEGLLQSQQEQLAELKAVMEQMTADRDDQTNLTAPSTPGGGSKFDGAASVQGRDPSESHPPASPLAEPVSPAYPTSFTQLIQPVLRTDVAAYEDFKLLARTTRNRAGNRTSSSSLSGINVKSLTLGLSEVSGPTNTHSSTPSTSSLPGGLTSAPSSPQAPVTPAGPLKDTKFFKRVLVEDIEPTLRLDTAPGLSWLARRSVLTAIADGTMVVEPAPAVPIIPAAPSPQHYPCALCGETKKDDAHLRTHRFRTSESESAQRYPLCGYCLARVRSTCDFLGFLRIVKDGHWRAGGDEESEEKAGWEESVRLREQMFWARIGGGVVPTGSREECPAPGPEKQGEAAGETTGEGDGDEATAATVTPESNLRADASPRITVQTPPDPPKFVHSFAPGITFL
ncbi:related to protein transport protein [Cephalotrichum gorgonifer]|uniref:Related to protein transport protein n=1 Tax=Cephalotrichum gorgonifer TaxID=2041049 RepID=A0AAE8MZR3_9PEZI|nr:related to protein transport protein [Cephalotrichum gorgonifer]